jgi:two-component system cell cycle sensor histidine kinase/response regulator CckA
LHLNLVAYIDQRPKSWIIATSIVLVILIGLLDYATGVDISVAILYLIPISLITWYAGKSWGMIMAVFSALCWLTADLLWHSVYSHPLIPYWNALVRLLIFLYTAGILSALKRLNDGLEDAVESKTRVLTQEIAERKKAEDALRDSEERLSLILNSAAEGIFGIDRTGVCLFCNPSGVRMLGYADEEELLGEDMHALVDNPQVKGTFDPEHEGAIYQVLNNGTHIHREGEFFSRKNGKAFTAEYWAYPLLKDNHVVGAVITFIDITERLALENQLRQSQKMEAIGQLAGGVAHDFNNILSAIVGYSHLTLTRMRENDVNRRNIEQILSSSERAASLTRSLLAFSRKQTVNLERTELNDLVVRFEKFLARLLREDIELIIKTAERPLIVMADAGQIELALMNLVTNARDAIMKAGRIIIETGFVKVEDAYATELGFGRSGEYALMAVSDTGNGIPQNIKTRIFDPFFTTKEVGKGTGLGLSLVYGIVKKHNGYINVYSRQEKGTTFKMYLPLAREQRPAELPTESEHTPLQGGTETVLIAEDDAPLRTVYSTVLRNFGYTVIEAVDGSDAVDKFAENRGRVGIIILDGIMPKMNGKEAWQQIRALEPGIRAIFISGYAEDVFTKDGILEGEAAFVAKPSSPEVLVRKIREVLDGP